MSFTPRPGTSAARQPNQARPGGGHMRRAWLRPVVDRVQLLGGHEILSCSPYRIPIPAAPSPMYRHERREARASPRCCLLAGLHVVLCDDGQLPDRIATTNQARPERLTAAAGSFRCSGSVRTELRHDSNTRRRTGAGKTACVRGSTPRWQSGSVSARPSARVCVLPLRGRCPCPGTVSRRPDPRASTGRLHGIWPAHGHRHSRRAQARYARERQ